MDKLTKSLAQIPEKERRKIKTIVKKISRRDFKGLDLKKLSGRDDIYRVRQGDRRIIFRLIKDEAYILAVEKRSDNTYNF